MENTQGLQALLRAKRDFDRVVNKTERSSRQAAKALGAMLASFDIKYGPQKLDWDDLARLSQDE